MSDDDPLAEPDDEGSDGDSRVDAVGARLRAVDWVRGAKWLAGLMLVGALLYSWYLAAAAFGILPVGLVTIALVAGLGLLPLIWYLFGRELPRSFRTVGARILWTIGALIHGPYILDWTERGSVEVRRADPETDRMRVDGEWVEIDADGNWSRLGKSEFGVSWEKTDEALRGAAVEPDGRRPDGGLIHLGKRGGQAIATQIISTGENLVVDVSRLVNRYRGAAGGAVADAAKRDGLRDHGGSGNISAKWLIIGIISSLALGAISGWVMFVA